MNEIAEYLKRRGVKRYTVYKLKESFPFHLLDLNKLNINLPCTPYFQYITIEFWGPGYGVVFYNKEGVFATHIGSGFAEEKNAIESFYDLLLDMSQIQGAL